MSLGARIKRTTNLAVPSWSLVAVTFTEADWDTNACWSVSTPTRLTCKTAGVYLISGAVSFAANATGPRDIGVRINGTLFVAAQRIPSLGATSTTDCAVSTTVTMQVNDYAELTVFQYVNPPGTNLNILASNDFSPRFSIVRIADV